MVIKRQFIKIYNKKAVKNDRSVVLVLERSQVAREQCGSPPCFCDLTAYGTVDWPTIPMPQPLQSQTHVATHLRRPHSTSSSAAECADSAAGDKWFLRTRFLESEQHVVQQQQQQ